MSSCTSIYCYRTKCPLIPSYVSIMKILYTVIFAWLCTPFVYAAINFPKPRSEIIEKSQFIGAVKLFQGQEVSIQFNGEQITCGGIYKATVDDALLGSGPVIEFLSRENLTIGERYVVFLTAGDTSSEDVFSTNSFMAPMLQKSQEIRVACESTYSGLKSIRYLTSRFASRRNTTTDDTSGPEWWVEYSSFASHGSLQETSPEYGGKDVTVVSFLVESVRIMQNTVEVLSYKELNDDYRNEESKYPYTSTLSEQLMKWSEYRAAIIKEIERSKHNHTMKPTR